MRANVPDELVGKFANLRSAYANLLVCYEKELSKTPEAEKVFFSHVRSLFPREMSQCHDFQSAYEVAVKSISLFNTHYLKCICEELPQDIR